MDGVCNQYQKATKSRPKSATIERSSVGAPKPNTMQASEHLAAYQGSKEIRKHFHRAAKDLRLWRLGTGDMAVAIQ